MKTEAKTQSKECLRLPEAGRDEEGLSPGGPRGSMALAIC